MTTEVDDVDFDTCGEVRTKTYKTDSPARVVCHSPSSKREGSVVKQESAKIRTPPQHQGGEKKSAKSLSFDEGVKKKPSSAKKNISTENVGSKGTELSLNFIQKKVYFGNLLIMESMELRYFSNEVL